MCIPWTDLMCAGTVNCCAFDDDGEVVVSVSYDGTARISNVGSGKAVHVIDCFNCPVLSAVTSQGMAYVGCTMGKVRQIDMKTGKVRLLTCGAELREVWCSH